MEQFKFKLQRFSGEEFIPDEGTQILTVSGNVLKPASGSILSGNTLSFSASNSSTIETPPKTLNDYTWAEISAIAQAGTGANYFNIGDTKQITLNGAIGDRLTLNNETLSVFILHFNYPMNGTTENNIIFGGFKTTDGIDVALCDSLYFPISMQIVSNNELACFAMNGYSSNYGGWKGARLRYDPLGATSNPPSEYGQTRTTANVGYNATVSTLTSPKTNTLLAALPSDFRNVLRLWSRWIDAKGNSSNVEENIEETIDAVTLLTEFEVMGACNKTNTYEQNHQTQMAYYAAGNSIVRYMHSDISSTANWWLASPSTLNNQCFCTASSDGNTYDTLVSIAYGLAPAFKV